MTTISRKDLKKMSKIRPWALWEAILTHTLQPSDSYNGARRAAQTAMSFMTEDRTTLMLRKVTDGDQAAIEDLMPLVKQYL